MDNHILEGSYPTTVPGFIPRDANLNHQIVNVIAMVDAGKCLVAEKSKTDMSPPRTPATERKSKRQKLKAGAGSIDFTKVGIFHCKEGNSISELFPADLTKNYCSFFCFRNKKCTKHHQACKFDHIGRWDKVPANDQLKILEHCDATKGKRV
jgi:hypothetical protein